VGQVCAAFAWLFAAASIESSQLSEYTTSREVWLQFGYFRLSNYTSASHASKFINPKAVALQT
jgi:hypothetical protein